MMRGASANGCDAAGRPPLVARICLCVAIIISGLTLRRFGIGLGLPAIIVKYGGSMLWATMVFFLVAMARIQNMNLRNENHYYFIIHIASSKFTRCAMPKK